MKASIERRVKALEQGQSAKEDMGGVIFYSPGEGAAEECSERFLREHPGHGGTLFVLPDNGRGA